MLNAQRLIVVVIVCLVCSPLVAAEPSVLFIAVDDLRPELACYGARAHTPNLDFARNANAGDRGPARE